MVKVKDMATVRAKWQGRVSIAGPDYEAGVSDPSVDWEGPTKAAESTYKEAVVKAANEGRYGRGVSRAGNAKWRDKTVSVGPGRWNEGVNKGGDAYDKGMGPVLSAIGGATLPKRYPAGDDRNLERVRAMNKAVHAVKGK